MRWNRHCLEAVSYTHLDVYKRQGHTGIGGHFPLADLSLMQTAGEILLHLDDGNLSFSPAHFLYLSRFFLAASARISAVQDSERDLSCQLYSFSLPFVRIILTSVSYTHLDVYKRQARGNSRSRLHTARRSFRVPFCSSDFC